jgi:hypothetical protein
VEPEVEGILLLYSAIVCPCCAHDLLRLLPASQTGALTAAASAAPPRTATSIHRFSPLRRGLTHPHLGDPHG